MEPTPDRSIRPATIDDAEAIGAAHAQAWAETYSGLVPPPLLARMTDAGQRAAWWGRALAEPPPGSATFVAEVEGCLVGFGDCGPARDADLGAAGEVNAIYILRAAQGRGRGGALLRRMAGHLSAAGLGSAGAWVLATNAPARAFYAATSAAAATERINRRPDGDLKEVGYVWGDLARLVRGTR